MPATRQWVPPVGAPASERLPPQGLLAPKEAVETALRLGDVPGAGHPYMQHLNKIQGELTKAGLPTSAEGVRVVVVGEGNLPEKPVNAHSESVLQTLAGSIGLAKGANVEVAVQGAPAPTFEALYGGSKLKLDQLGAVGRDSFIRAMTTRQRELAEVVSRLPPNAPTTLVNMSNAMQMTTLLRETMEQAAKAPAGSPLHEDVSKLLGHPFNSKNEDDVKKLGNHVADVYRKQLGSPEVAKAREALEKDVASARGHGVMVFKAAGNGNPKQIVGQASDWQPVDTVKGMISIGAIDLGANATDARDDQVAPFSVEGAVIGAVGVNVPLRFGDRNGTSYATPFVVSVAALMLKANPKLKPDDVERILKATAFQVGGAKLKEVDVAKAVAMAKSSK